ncbi:hypothetical protein V3C99_006112 [Haemonchus contortus]
MAKIRSVFSHSFADPPDEGGVRVLAHSSVFCVVPSVCVGYGIESERSICVKKVIRTTLCSPVYQGELFMTLECNSVSRTLTERRIFIR